jgi:ABC-type transport system substrate-binding protein
LGPWVYCPGRLCLHPFAQALVFITMNNMFSRFLCCIGLTVVGVGSLQAQTVPAEKVLRYAFEIAETGFDPAQITDYYSRTATENMFDALYRYDYLARPAKVIPNVADGMPVIADDFKTFTVKVKPGIYFADDPAFGGKKRELTAQDFVYTFKRIFDPKTKSQIYSDLEDVKLLGMDPLRRDAEKPGASFNYDTEVEGLRALDRYTIQFRLAEPKPRFVYLLTESSTLGAVAREVVEKYGDKIMEHPVGTGPFKLDQWTRSSKITFVKNPNFREEYFEAEPPANDALSQEIYRQMKGKRIPIVDKVEISIIDEVQPRWLSFLGNEHDFLMYLPAQFANQVIPNNQLAPHLAKKGIRIERYAAPELTFSYFNMENPTVGGNSTEKVALRRAIALAYNTEEEIRLPRRNQAVSAQGVIPPNTWGYDPKFKSEMSDYNPARAKALLDMFGYVDKDGDGWRDMPDGKPLLLEYATSPSAADRELNEVWKKSMMAAGIKIVFKTAKWPENLKSARAGKVMMWGLGNSASSPDGGSFLDFGYGPQRYEGNLAAFQNDEYDKLFRQQVVLPDGPERLAIMKKMVKILVAYMPYKFNTHRIRTDMVQPWLLGYRRHPTSRAFWRYVDIDTSKLPKR